MSEIHSSHGKRDLDWRAFCYVVGEMADAEGEQFERELAEDQQAREAVARAIELTSSLELAMAVPLSERAVSGCVLAAPARSPTAANWRQPRTWLVCGSAACLMFVLVYASYHFSLGGRLSRPAAEVPSDVKAAQLAVVWSESRGQEVLPRDSSPVFAAGWSLESVESAVLAGEPAVPVEPGGAAGEGADQIAPLWMLTALAGLMESPEAPGELSQ